MSKLSQYKRRGEFDTTGKRYYVEQYGKLAGSCRAAFVGPSAVAEPFGANGHLTGRWQGVNAVSIRGARGRILDEVSGWDEVTLGPHRFGGTEFRLGKRELGHIHGDSLVDIPFPKPIRDEIVSAGEAEPHHILPETGWVSVFLRSNEDVERAIRLLRRSFSLAVEHRRRLTRTASAGPG